MQGEGWAVRLVVCVVARLVVCVVALAGAAACDKDDYSVPGGRAGAGGDMAGGEGGAGGAGAGNGAGGGGGGAASGGPGAAGGAGNGSGGGGGGGGAVDGGGVPACTIPCLADIVGGCVPGGACVQQGTVVSGLNTCYANGVMTTLMFGTEALVLTYRKPGGAACYSIETLADALAQRATYTYKDASGTTIGTGAVDAVSRTFTFTCDGQSYDLGTSGCGTLPPTPGVVGTGGAAASCTEGPCPM
jgi:hypothetical protein